MATKTGKCLIYIYFLSIILYGCSPKPRLSEWAENYLYIDETYVYNPDTILQFIANEEVNQQTFQVFSLTKDGDPPPKEQYWNHADYLALSNAFLNWSLSDATYNWALLEITFDSKCEDIHEFSNTPLSPLNWLQASATFYKPDINLEYGIPNRRVIKIILSPNFGTLQISEWIYNPIPFDPDVVIADLGSLDSPGVVVKVEDAFRIAENAGGSQYDSCTIFARNSIEDEYDGWYIYYHIEKGVSFNTVVNDQSGEHEITDN